MTLEGGAKARSVVAGIRDRQAQIQHVDERPERAVPAGGVEQAVPVQDGVEGRGDLDEIDDVLGLRPAALDVAQQRERVKHDLVPAGEHPERPPARLPGSAVGPQRPFVHPHGGLAGQAPVQVHVRAPRGEVERVHEDARQPGAARGSRPADEARGLEHAPGARPVGGGHEQIEVVILPPRRVAVEPRREVRSLEQQERQAARGERIGKLVERDGQRGRARRLALAPRLQGVQALGGHAESRRQRRLRAKEHDRQALRRRRGRRAIEDVRARSQQAGHAFRIAADQAHDQSKFVRRHRVVAPAIVSRLT